MRSLRGLAAFMVAAGIFAQGCGGGGETESTEGTPAEVEVEVAAEPTPEPIQIAPGPDVQSELQEALIEAEPGDVIELAEGTYDLLLGLSLDVDNVTLRGAGMDKTVLDFKNQEAGSEGLFIKSDNVLLQDFAIQDTKGNALKAHSTTGLVVRRVRTEWTGGPKATNGAYGIYPVSGNNTLLEECVAIGASDAGVYVGQSEHVIIRNCRAEYNVAGIEIENCHHAEAYDNIATNNTGGILVFDLPDLPVQHGGDVRLYRNKVFNNNTPNFAPEGNIVANVAPGTGVMIMANTNVEIFENDIRDNNTYGIVVTSYLSTGIHVKDPNYYPYAEAVHIHNNTFGKNGTEPSGKSGKIVALVVGSPIPDVIWDGVYNPEKLVDGKLPPSASVVLNNNTKEDGELTFADVGGARRMDNPAEAKVNRDLAAFTGELPPVEPVEISVIH